jgi:DNA-binding NtrC family response regulator
VKTGRILVVDDDEDILTAGRLLLRRQFAEVFTCSVPSQIPELLGNHDFDVVLLDMNFGPGESSGQQGLEWLRTILEIDPSLVVIMITALGATDFVAKPWQNEKIVATVSAGLQLHSSRIEAQTLRQANRALVDAASPGDNSIIGSSTQMQQVLSVVERTAPTDANVLILGENGTGKELWGQSARRCLSLSYSATRKARLPALTMIESVAFRRLMAALFFLTRSATSRCPYKQSCCAYSRNEQ